MYFHTTIHMQSAETDSKTPHRLSSYRESMMAKMSQKSFIPNFCQSYGILEWHSFSPCEVTRICL